MLIDDRNLAAFVESNMRDIQNANFQIHARPCPHCGIPVRYPVVARAEDVDAFRKIIESAYRVMQKYGIAINLLAEIHTECHVEIARRKALNG